MFRADYLRHEYVYAAHPTTSGWNDQAVDQEILGYVKELLSQAQVEAPARLLEIGCGMGNLSIPLAGAGFQVVGIDISPTAIGAARQRARQHRVQVSFKVGNILAHEIYHDLDAFDCILDGLCWHCIIGADRQRFLDLAHQSLKPEGSLLIITMCGDPRAKLLISRFDPISRYILNGQIAERYLGLPRHLENELSSAGFTIAYKRLIEGNASTDDQDMFLAVARPF